MCHSFSLSNGGAGYRMRGDGGRGFEMGYEMEENKLARKRWEKNGPKIEAPTTPS